MKLIYKMTAHPTVDFAAEELKKYLRMMDPDDGDVRILSAEDGREGFRLGLLGDLGIDVPPVEDPVLDDFLYADTNGTAGVIAGGNPRSVLLAVYEYLRQNGCRWLFPGVDGESIPLCTPGAVRFEIKPSLRYRGPCIEGATSQEILLETIDFLPKVGMNVFMMQFFTPTVFYNRYYSHAGSTVRKEEPVSGDTMRQWKAACESEMEKRGIQFHDVGHGWTAAPFGVNVSEGWTPIDDDVPEEGRRYLALVNGKRGLHKGVALNTQFCMSSEEARLRVSNAVAAYAERHPNVDYVHVWLGDSHNNHCECASCVRETVSDLYVKLLNGIDAALTARGLPTRIVFIAYTETTWAPVKERITHPERFTLMLAPISRSYTRTMTDAEITLPPFRRNDVTLPRDLDEYMAHFKEWRKVWKGATLCYEYHFWKHQLFDPSGLFLARRIYEDVEAYAACGVGGLIACGSQRSYFPTGFAYYVFARKQFDLSVSYEALADDYFGTAFGKDAEEVLGYLGKIAEAFGDKYLEGEESADAERSLYYCPARAKKLRTVSAITEHYGEMLAKYRTGGMPRVQTASLRILEMHAAYCTLLAESFAKKAEGDAETAYVLFGRLTEEMSAREYETERYFDHHMAVTRLKSLLKK